MSMAVPNMSTLNWHQFKGLTNKVGAKGLPTDYQQFTVSNPGEFNFKLNNPYTTLQIVNQRNEVVATAKAGSDPADASAKLGPGTYRAIISRQFATNQSATTGEKGEVNANEYKVDISVRANVLTTAGGGMLRGIARTAEGNDSGVQKHTLNVVQGGEFSANLSLPNTRWVIMDKDGKVKASGDTMSAASTDPLNRPGFKLEPGQYELMVVPPRTTTGETPYNLQLVPKGPAVEMPTKERDFDRIMRERDERLAQWASQDAQKSSGTSVTA